LACQDLHKVACQQNIPLQLALQVKMGTVKAQHTSFLEKYIGFEDKVIQKIFKMKPPIFLLKENIVDSVRAHLDTFNALLDENGEDIGREKMLDIFINHYGHTTVGLVHANSATLIDSYEGYIDFLVESDKIESEFAEGIKSQINRPKARMVSIFTILFNHLPTEKIRSFIKDFITAQFVGLRILLSVNLDKDQHFVSQVSNILVPKNGRVKIQKMLDEIKIKSKDLLNKIIPDVQERKDQARKIDEIKLVWRDQEDFSKAYIPWNQYISHFNALYNHENNKITVHLPFLYAPYWQSYWTLAHEITHSIPINLLEDFMPCFEGEGLNFSSHHFLEVIADFFATEIMMAALKNLPNEKQRKNILNSVWLCGPYHEYTRLGKNPHPSPRSRINLILRAHPQVNHLFACQDSPPYCGRKKK